MNLKIVMGMLNAVTYNAPALTTVLFIHKFFMKISLS